MEERGVRGQEQKEKLMRFKKPNITFFLSKYNLLSDRYILKI